MVKKASVLDYIERYTRNSPMCTTVKVENVFPGFEEINSPTGVCGHSKVKDAVRLIPFIKMRLFS